MSYEVGISPEAALSVFHEDEHGRLIFAIELGDDPKKIYLNPRPSQNSQIVNLNNAVTKARVDTAVQRLKSYFEGQGLSVEVD